jgi:DNA-directed RNA polymerase sigma subunit (sigma70/sigma32)
VRPPRLPSPTRRPESLADGQLIARLLTDVAADLAEARARYKALTQRRAELIRLAAAMTVDGRPVTDRFIAELAGVTNNRVQQIRTKRRRRSETPE